MSTMTVEYLITQGILVQEDPSKSQFNHIVDDGFCSYVIADNYVIQTIAQADQTSIATVNYVQLCDITIDHDERRICQWIIQLEGFKDHPNNIDTQCSGEFTIFRKIAL